MNWSVSASGRRDDALISLARQAAGLAVQTFEPAAAVLCSQTLALLKLAGEAQPNDAVIVLAAHGRTRVPDGEPFHSLSMTISSSHLPAAA